MPTTQEPKEPLEKSSSSGSGDASAPGTAGGKGTGTTGAPATGGAKGTVKPQDDDRPPQN